MNENGGASQRTRKAAFAMRRLPNNSSHDEIKLVAYHAVFES